MAEEEKKQGISRHVDKIIMGAIIGGAVLSVIGVRRLAKKKREQEQSETPKKRGILRRLLGF